MACAFLAGQLQLLQRNDLIMMEKGGGGGGGMASIWSMVGVASTKKYLLVTSGHAEPLVKCMSN